MADATTIYDIETRYKLKDRGMAGKVRKISGEVRGLSGAWEHAKGSLTGFSDVWNAGRAITDGLRRASSSLIGFNSDMEQSRITMAGMIRMNTGQTFAEGMKTAQDMLGRFQKIAKASVGTTKDFVEMATLITRPVLKAKLGMDDLVSVTKGAVIAARAMGIEAGVAALDIEQVLSGQVGKRDRFARALLEPFLEKRFGIVEYMRKTKKGTLQAVSAMDQFNKLTEQQRGGILQAALTQPAIAEMAAAQEQSFSGVISTFQDSLEMAIGKVGLPLFQKITAEVQGWNAWIERNSATLESMGAELGSALAHGFGVVKDAVGFLVEHRKVFFALAKVFLAVKAGQIGVGLAKGIGGAAKKVGDFVKSLGGAKKGLMGLIDGQKSAIGVLGSLTGKFAAAIPVIGGLIAGVGVIKAVIGEFGKEESARIEKNKALAKKGVLTQEQMLKVAKARATVERGGAVGQAGTTLGRLQAAEAKSVLKTMAGTTVEAERQLMRSAIKAGMIEVVDTVARQGPGPGKLGVSTAALGKVWRDAGPEQAAALASALEATLGRFKIGYKFEEFVAGVTEDAKADKPARDLEDEYLAAVARGQNVTNVTVHRVEVSAADPNRFVHALVGEFEKFNRAPSQARDALRGGL